MAESNDGQEKTEDPTPKRKDKAKEDGQIVTSKEMFVFATMAGGTLMLFFIGGFSQAISNGFAGYFIIDPGQALDHLLIARLGNAIYQTALAGLIVGIPLMIAILLIQMAVGGIVFSPKAMGFKFEKLNPLKGLKRMVSLQALVELVKAILKVTILLAATGAVLWPLMAKMMGTVYLTPADSLVILGQAMIRVLGAMLVGLVIIGAIDLGYQIYSNTQKLMMTRQEVKEENKESEGSPEMKGKLRQKQFEASRKGARNRAALDDVANATAVITNPTHFAVALRYIPGEDTAPVILAMGRGPLAHEIMDRAKAKKIHILREPLLARALYFTGELGEEINYMLYAAVATILAYVYKLDRGQWDEQPNVEVPSELHFNEFGRPNEGAKE